MREGARWTGVGDGMRGEVHGEAAVGRDMFSGREKRADFVFGRKRS